MNSATRPKHQTYGTRPRSPEETKRIRAWAHAKGIPCGDRGRLPVSIVKAYEQEMKDSK